MNKIVVKEEIDSLKDKLDGLKAEVNAITCTLVEKRIINEEKLQKDSDEYLELTKRIDEEEEIAYNNTMMYTNIKSNFIKNELKKTSWNHRLYISELMKIELLATGKTFGLPTGYIRSYLEEKYPKQWKAIWMELNPKGYEKALQHKQKMRENRERDKKKFRKESEEDLQKEKEAWKRAGGTIEPKQFQKSVERMLKEVESVEKMLE